jgi:hypothetical protein
MPFLDLEPFPMFPRLFTVVALAVFPVPANATAVVGVDVLSQWQRERIARLGTGDAFAHSNAGLVRQMLVDPASPYSAMTDAPGFTNEVDWPDIVRTIKTGEVSLRDALTVMQWDLGMTRARPGVDLLVRRGYRDDFVAASATKADVDPDIFWHMLDLSGFRHSARGATFAVGLQILRTQMARIPPERYVAVGIDADVFNRVMQAQHMDQVTSYDLNYLSTLVQYRLIHWRAGERASTGLRALPMAFRVSRVAAAYRDALAYVSGPTCHKDGSPVSGTAGTGAEGDTRPLCFVGATDRAVHRWYLDEVRRQATYVPEREERGLQRLIKFAAAVLALMDMAAVVEVVEAVIADDLVASDAITGAQADVAAERADLLFCPFPE